MAAPFFFVFCVCFFFFCGGDLDLKPKGMSELPGTKEARRPENLNTNLGICQAGLQETMVEIIWLVGSYGGNHHKPGFLVGGVKWISSIHCTDMVAFQYADRV